MAKALKTFQNDCKKKLKCSMIEQKGMTVDHDFCYSFSFSSSIFTLRKEKKEKK